MELNDFIHCIVCNLCSLNINSLLGKISREAGLSHLITGETNVTIKIQLSGICRIGMVEMWLRNVSYFKI